MAQVSVTIAGKAYRIACDDGDESRLAALAEVVDAQVESMRRRFGEIGDRRLLIMAAVNIADELVETSRRVRDLEAAIAMPEIDASRVAGEPHDWRRRIATDIEAVAERIERVASDLGGAVA